MNLKRLNFNWLNLSHNRVIHGFKTAFACVSGLAIAKFFNWQAGQGVPITIMVVMSAQVHFGAALQKSYMRFLGTIAGVSVAVITLLFFSHNIFVIFLVVFFAILIFAYIASSAGDISYAGTLGGVTVILTLTGQQVGVEYAVQRGLYIILGIVIALLTSRFLFPIHARDRFRFHVVMTLRNLKKLFIKGIALESEEFGVVIDEKLEDCLTRDLTKQPRLIYEACLGSRAFAAKKKAFSEIVSGERRIMRFITLMRQSLCEIKTRDVLREQLADAAELYSLIESEFDALIDRLEKTSVLAEEFDMEAALIKIKILVEKTVGSKNADIIMAENSFLFALEQIFRELQVMKVLFLQIYSGGKVVSNLL